MPNISTIKPIREARGNQYLMIGASPLMKAVKNLSQKALELYLCLSTLQEGVAHNDAEYLHLGMESEDEIIEAKEELYEKGYILPNRSGNFSADYEFHQIIVEPHPKSTTNMIWDF